MSQNEWSILKSPLVTERTTALKEKYNQYVFRVDTSTTKGMVKDTVQKLFKVHVKQVRTVHMPGKLKRLSQGKPSGKRSDWKKAIVTLKKGDTIDLNSSVGSVNRE